MTTLADMGGRAEFYGPVQHVPEEPAFHADWERRAFGCAVFASGVLNPTGPDLDSARWAIEQIEPEDYLGPYYWRWLRGLELQLEQLKWLRPGEVDARIQGEPPLPGGRHVAKVQTKVAGATLRMIARPTLPRWMAAHLLPRVIGGNRPTLRRPRFKVGGAVRVRSERIDTHTRQPGYVTGKPGTIVGNSGAARFSDERALGRRSKPQYVYTVAFAGRDLWGEAAEPDTEVRIELFESYLEAP
ncbi:MAG: nitrile hydratase subunit beta [Propionibacteriales bacterium]|nr:nitrile hydratase subunit beta [Propionibacteriales bacterium]